MIDLVIIDDHSILIEGIRAILSECADIAILGDARTARAGIDLVAAFKPQVAIIDLSLPDMHGLRLAEKLIADHPRIKIVVLTAQEDRASIQQSFAIGAHGFIIKRSAADHLRHAIRAVAAGGTYLDPATTTRMVGWSGRKPRRSSDQLAISALTDRESEVLRLIAHGFTLKEIAARLNVAVKSIETYKLRATEKLDLHSRAQIVSFAVTEGWMNSVA